MRLCTVCGSVLVFDCKIFYSLWCLFNAGVLIELQCNRKHVYFLSHEGWRSNSGNKDW